MKQPTFGRIYLGHLSCVALIPWLAKCPSFFSMPSIGLVIDVFPSAGSAKNQHGVVLRSDVAQSASRARLFMIFRITKAHLAHAGHATANGTAQTELTGVSVDRPRDEGGSGARRNVLNSVD